MTRGCLCAEKSQAFRAKESMFQGLESGLMVKSIGCSCREPGFWSWHPYVDSQPPVTPVAGDPMSSYFQEC